MKNVFFKNGIIYEINIQLIRVAILPLPDLVACILLSMHQSLLFSHLS